MTKSEARTLCEKRKECGTRKNKFKGKDQEKFQGA
jgi:hypothetical protein